ncbi:MAG: tRNA wybutosine-synthesizing 3 family protein [Candidatus Woesearchaeota archaeon]
MGKIDYSKDFDLQKRLCLEKLYKPDKSRKGDVDKPIISLIEYLNSLKDYYTTSSCSGRIYLLTESDKKPEVKWLYVSHEEVPLKDILDALSEENLKNHPKDRIWLRQENLILHVACRTIEDADMILKIARDIGLRRSGIIADSNIMIVEICSTEKMDVPVAEDGKILVTKEYIQLITDIANQKFFKGREKLELLEKDIREKLTKK